MMVEAVFAANSQFLSYDDLAFIMNWTTSSISRNAGLYLTEINRANFVVHGLPLLEIVRGKGVRVSNPKSKQFVIGPLEFTNHALIVASALDLRTAAAKDKSLMITASQFSKLGLTEAQLITALEEINKQNILENESILFEHVKLSVGDFTNEYFWQSPDGKLKPGGSYRGTKPRGRWGRML